MAALDAAALELLEGGPPGRAACVARLRELGALGPGFEDGRVLVVGCGAGELSLSIAEAWPKARVVALQLELALQGAAEKRRSKSPARNRVHLQPGRAQSLGFPDRCFDAVVIHGRLFEFEEHTAMFTEIARVLKRRGALLLSGSARSAQALRTPQIEACARLLLERAHIQRDASGALRIELEAVRGAGAQEPEPDEDED